MLREHALAKGSLRLLEADGVSRRVLLSFLYSYSHPEPPQRQQALRKRAGELALLLRKVGKLMESVGREIEATVPQFQMAPMEWQHFQEPRVIYALGHAAGEIAPLREHYHAISSLRGKLRNEGELVYLCQFIQATTGRPHWADIACLLGAAFLAHGKSEDWDADSLRKIVQRFKKAYPKLYTQTREFVRSDLGRSAPERSARRSTRNRRISESKPSTLTFHTSHIPIGH